MVEDIEKRWTVDYDFAPSSGLQHALQNALNCLLRDVECYEEEVRHYDSLVWKVNLQQDPQNPERIPGLDVTIAQRGQEIHFFGLPCEMDELTATYRLADELQTKMFDDFVQWPTIDGHIVEAGIISGAAVWHRKGAFVANVGELASLL